MTLLQSLKRFQELHLFHEGTYEVRCAGRTSPRTLLWLKIPRNEESGLRQVPRVELTPLSPFLLERQAEIEGLRLTVLKGELADRRRQLEMVDDRQQRVAAAKQLAEEERQADEQRRNLEAQSTQSEQQWSDQRSTLSCLVRAGLRHPGLRDEEMAAVHREAEREHHIELFTDLNALTTGLLTQVSRSLGRRVGRVVLASSSIDILHEYQALSRRSIQERLVHAEMARALYNLEDLRHRTPVHIHQLPPGATRYFSRRNATPAARPESDDEERTYISEDRQMVAAFWDYLSTTNPRVPVRLLTSDLALARVCRAERVPMLFARTPHEEWRQLAVEGALLPLQTLYWDPFALRLCFCTAHEILWELCQVFRHIDVVRIEPGSTSDSFTLKYEPARQMPSESPHLELIPNFASSPSPPPVSSRASAAATVVSSGADRGSPAANQAAPHTTSPKSTASRGSAAALAGATVAFAGAALMSAMLNSREGKLRITLQSILTVLPTRPTQQIPLSSFASEDRDRLRQLRQVGETTQLYQIETDRIIAGPSLSDMLAALTKGDYIRINEIFRRIPTYNNVLNNAAAGEPFPSSAKGGTVTGWAIVLGAAYKTADRVFYGLADVADTSFEREIRRTHEEIGRGEAAVPLPQVLDRVCRRLQMSPIRFEVLLNQCLGHGALRSFEPQRALVDENIPLHPVLVAPASADPTSYMRMMSPGKGVLVGDQLMGSLVRRIEVA